MQHWCREYTMPRNEKRTRARGWIRKDTRIGPVLNIKVCYRNEQQSTEVQVPSLFQDETISWVKIVNGVDRCVTESMPTAKEEEIASVKPIAKARPWQKPTVTLTSVSIPVLKGNGSTLKHNDHTIKSVIECQKLSPDCCDIDGAIQHNDIIEECRKKKLDGASQWSLEEWISTLAKGGWGAKKRFSYCLNPSSSKHFLYFRAIQGHSGENAFDPPLQDNVLLPKGFTEYIYHVGNANELNSIIRNGLIPGGKSLKRGRQAVFCTTVNPMEDGNTMGEPPRDLTQPRIGNAFKIRYVGAIWSWPKRGVCNFTRHGTHCLQLASRKRYVWKLRTSDTKRFAWLQECHGLYSNRTRNTVNKIHKAKTQDHLGTDQAIRRVTVKLVATSWITEFLEYLFLQSSSRIQHVRTRSRS